MIDLIVFLFSKRLENLFLNNINISKVYFDDVDYDGKTRYFKKLKSLGLNQNKIDNARKIKRSLF
jgi:hypothetical protein